MSDTSYHIIDKDIKYRMETEANDRKGLSWVFVVFHSAKPLSCQLHNQKGFYKSYRLYSYAQLATREMRSVHPYVENIYKFSALKG